MGRGLKGKQVKILYSPAAVSSINVLNNTFATGYSGRRSKTGVSQKTCQSFSIFRSFRGKSDETSADEFSFCHCSVIFGSYLNGSFIVK